MKTYHSFDLMISPATDGATGIYQARVLDSPSGQGSVHFELPVAIAPWQDQLQLVGGAIRAFKPYREEEALDHQPLNPQTFGTQLFTAIFQGEVAEVFQRSLALVKSAGSGLRIRLRLNEAPGLAALPWEYLYDASHHRFLVLTDETPIVRYLALPQAEVPLMVEPPLRLLVLTADANEVSDTTTFNGRMALRIELFDTRVGQNDGDGIGTVTFTILDNFSGEPVYANVEEAAPFCLFGGNDPLCTTFVFAQNGLHWPTGEPIYNDNYTAQIDIQALNGDQTQWRWLFNVQGAANRPGNGGDTTAVDFTGSWFTNFAEVTLQQTGNSVTGSYKRYGYNEQIALIGDVTGQTLNGYFGDNNADRIRFTLRNDGNSFDGAWLYRVDGRERQWCGIRVGLGALPDGCGFSGDWLTISDYAPANQPTARLQQVGPNVSGTFFNGSDSGTIIGNLGEQGAVRHHTLSGIYAINGNSDTMQWELLDFSSEQFSGCWINQEGPHAWCGWRLGGSQPAQCMPVAGCP